MINKTILILLSIISLKVIAQKDTLYFDASWQKTTKKNAVFFRPMPLKKAGYLYQIKDYYFSNGNLQMEGFLINLEKEIYDGTTIWYYENGNKKQEETIQNGALNGIAKNYFEDGTLKSEGVYKNDKPYNGTFTNCCPYETIDQVENGKTISYYQYYKNTKIIASKTILDDKKNAKEEIYYNKKGEEIGRVSIKPIDNYKNGKHIEFNTDNDRNIIGIFSISSYNNGVLEGVSEDYDVNEKRIAKGIYKNEKPYSGSFRRGNEVINYVDGIIEGEEISYNKNIIVAKGINKNGMHWQGQFKVSDDKIFSYKNGKIEGKQTTYYSAIYYFNGVKSYHHILNDEKEGESAYFNENGKEIAKGIYKNNQPWTGTFYNDYFKTLEAYKEGQKHGLCIQYDYNGKIVSQQEYENGKKSGLVKTEGYFSNKTCTCIYKKGEPFTGEVCEDLSVLIYKNGKIIKRKTFQSKNQNILEEEQFYNKDEEVVKKITYKNNKKYEVSIKEGYPYNGQVYNTYGNRLLTYKNGKLNGPFTEGTSLGIKIEGNFKNDLWDGIFHFSDNLFNTKTSCTFKDGKPMDGTIIDNNCIFTYKNGLKSGVKKCIGDINLITNKEYTIACDSIVQNYKEGKLDGKVHYFNKGKLVSDAIYSNGIITQGTEYVKNHIENKYKNSQLLQSICYFGDYKMVDTYKNNSKINETVFKNAQIIYNGNYKEGKPNNGTFITFDDKEDPQEYTVTQYKNGKKHQKEQTITIRNNSVIETRIYKKGLPVKTTKKFPFKKADSIVGIYKKGKPFTGYFHTKERFMEKVEHYKKGIKSGFQYYYGIGYGQKTATDSINYSNGKPYNGVEIEVSTGVFKHYYKDGKQTKIEVFENYYRGKIDPVFKIMPTSTGFITYEATEEKTFEKYNEITYTNERKTKGKVTFFIEKEKGYLTFDNEKIIDIKIKIISSYITFNIYLEKSNILVAEGKRDDYKIKMYPDYKLPSTPNYINFLSINDFLFRGDGLAKFYINDKLASTCTIKKEQGYNGVVIKKDKKGLFIYRKHLNGKIIETRKRLTKEELLKLLDK